MENFELQINIKASAAQVWFVLWNDTYYRKWTSPFCQGSYAFAVSDWKEKSKIHFLGPKGYGMYGIIEENKLYEKMVFQHIGYIKNKAEMPLDEETKKWSGARERYELKEANGITTLQVKADVANADFMDFFKSAFPKALDLVKKYAEEDFRITVSTLVNASIESVWAAFTETKHILKWNHASDDWHTTKAEIELHKGGKFFYRMEAKDGSMGFDFEAFNNSIIPLQEIHYTTIDNRKVSIIFSVENGIVSLVESFTPEYENAFELQEIGWQSILNYFKKYVEEMK